MLQIPGRETALLTIKVVAGTGKAGGVVDDQHLGMVVVPSRLAA